MKGFIGLLLLFQSISLLIKGQTEIVPQADGATNSEQLESQQIQWSEPININIAKVEEVAALPGCSYEQAIALLNYRDKYGPFISIWELQAVRGMTPETFEQIRTHIYIGEKPEAVHRSVVRRFIEAPTHYFIWRTTLIPEARKGFTTKSYLGNPMGMQFRYRVAVPGDFSAGFIMEKDPGEPNLADYTSIHVQLKDKRYWKNLIIGDYQAQFGQGLILGSSFGIGMNAEAITSVRRSSVGIVPYQSVQEQRMWRGAALSLGFGKRMLLHLMTSNISIDGNTDTVTTLNSSGLHRTAAEISRRKTASLGEHAVVLQYRHRQSEIGMIGYHLELDATLEPSHRPDLAYAFRGTARTSAGIFASHQLGIFSGFAEFAWQEEGHTACTAGVLAALTRQVEMTWLYRRISPGYFSWRMNAAVQGSGNNEEGLYWGWKARVNGRLTLSGYMDVFRFAWLRPDVYRPSDGFETLTRLTFKPSKQVSAYVQLRTNSKERNETGAVYFTTTRIEREQWTLSVRTTPQFGLSLQTTFGFSSFQNGQAKTEGFLITQDAQWSWGKWTISGRLALFDADHDNRMYSYERDVPLSWTYPAYEGIGNRYVVMAGWQVSKGLDVTVRVGRTQLPEREKIGSGNDEIQGNTRHEVKFQARIRI